MFIIISLELVDPQSGEILWQMNPETTTKKLQINLLLDGNNENKLIKLASAILFVQLVYKHLY